MCGLKSRTQGPSIRAKTVAYEDAWIAFVLELLGVHVCVSPSIQVYVSVRADPRTYVYTYRYLKLLTTKIDPDEPQTHPGAARPCQV